MLGTPFICSRTGWIGGLFITSSFCLIGKLIFFIISDQWFQYILTDKLETLYLLHLFFLSNSDQLGEPQSCWEGN